MDVLRVGAPNLMSQMSPHEFLEEFTKMANKERYEVCWKTGSRMAEKLHSHIPRWSVNWCCSGEPKACKDLGHKTWEVTLLKKKKKRMS